MTASLAAIAAERKAMSKLKALKATPIYFEIETLQQIAADSIPHKRKTTAEHHLAQVYGNRPVPPTEYLDLVFGLDMVVRYRGWIIGLDITLNGESLQAKSEKQSRLAQAYRKLGLDCWGILHVTEDMDIKRELSRIIATAK